MRKRCLTALLAVGLSSCMLVGCGSGGKSSSGKQSGTSASGQESDQEEVMLVEIKKEVPEGFVCKGESVQEAEEQWIEIHTLEDLESIPKNSKKSYILMEDIDCTNGEINIESFKGRLDGNYHQLQNVSSAVFESIIGGSVYNLAVIDSTSSTAGIVTELWEGSISNCYVTGEVGKNASGGEPVGGIVAKVLADQCNIYKCYNAAEVYGTYNTGGIVGEISSNDSDVFYPLQFSWCTNYGNIHGIKAGSTGGICGEVVFEKNDKGYSGNFLINNNVNYGTVHLNSNSGNGQGCAGGVIGYASIETNASQCDMTMDIQYCANYGMVGADEDGSEYIAGICGYTGFHNDSSSRASIEITNCLNSSVSEIPMVYNVYQDDGVIMLQNSINLSKISSNPMYSMVSDGMVSVQNCYFLNYHNSASANKEATPLEKEDMQNQESFEDFEFGYVWNMSEDYNNGYPYIVDCVENQEKMEADGVEEDY